MTEFVVWHRADLRVPDNAALAAATEAATTDNDATTTEPDDPESGDRVLPVFVFDPHYYGADGLACDARLRFMHQCLGDLRRQYRDRGSDLALLHGDPRERLPALLDGLDDPRLYVNRDVTARYGKARDDALLDGDGRPCPVETFADDGIVREDGERTGRQVDPAAPGREATPPDSRDGWSDQCEAYLAAEFASVSDTNPGDPLPSDVTVDEIEETYEVEPDKRPEKVPRGGRTAGLDRLEAFVDRLPEYPRNVAPPAAAERNASRLSPYLKFGALSVREVYQRVQRCPPSRGRSMFVSRLFWNRHYRQKLADWPGWMDRAVNPVFRGLYRSEHDPELERAWRRGETGFPMVDAAMRSLVETGYVNFRMRAMVASFFCYVLREPWRRGADFMYYHLLDADPGINHTQWQSQTGHVGVHPIRVYDPAKQAREYDPDGEFVREYVPELRDLPDEHLPRPEKAPLLILDEAGVELGEDYPYPVVDYERRASEARERFAALDDRAKEALFEDSEIRRRASLSSRGGSDEGDRGGDRSAGQSSLDEF